MSLCSPTHRGCHFHHPCIFLRLEVGEIWKGEKKKEGKGRRENKKMESDEKEKVGRGKNEK